MLSKTSMVIIGLLRKENLSAYDMLKKIDAMSMKYWFPIGNTTLYETALRLEKKQYISGSGDSSKRVFTLTESGREELKSTIRELFMRIDYDTVWFCLAIMYSPILDETELSALIEARRGLLLEYKGGTAEKLDIARKYNVPYYGLCAIDRMKEIIDFELNTLEKFAREHNQSGTKPLNG